MTKSGTMSQWVNIWPVHFHGHLWVTRIQTPLEQKSISGFIDATRVQIYEKITQYVHSSSSDIADPQFIIRTNLNLVSEKIAKLC